MDAEGWELGPGGEEGKGIKIREKRDGGMRKGSGGRSMEEWAGNE